MICLKKNGLRTLLLDKQGEAELRDFVFQSLAWLTAFFLHPKVEIATVADDYAVVYRRQKAGLLEPLKIDGLRPGTGYHKYGKRFSTLPRPEGKLLAVFVTVNDIHIGERICGFDSRHPKRGPILKNEPGKVPYAEMMSLNAVAEIKKLNPDAVLVKGDLTDAGKKDEIDKFLEIWGSFGKKLHWVCGNHDVHFQRPSAASLMDKVELPGVTLALLDTSIPQKPNGQVSEEQLTWLEEIAKTADRPVMVFGHHHIWNPEKKRDPNYFGINPDDSEKLIALFAKYPCFSGYFSGHTHSNKLENIKALPGVVFAQCGALKEFPGAWNEYRVYESGIQQIMHRLEASEPLKWQEQTSKMELGFYEKRHYGKLADRCFLIKNRVF